MIAALSALNACGGGGGSAAPPSLPPPPVTYSIGGSLSGLTSGASIVLTDNGADQLTITANGPFTFNNRVAQSSSYDVSILTQPATQSCALSQGSGSSLAANVTSVSVVCVMVSTDWARTGTMSTGRAFFGAVLLPDGQVLVAGGLAGGWYQVDSGTFFAGFNSSAELYNSTTGVWTTTGSMSTARQSLTVTLLPNGTVLAVGGSVWTAPPTNMPQSLSVAEVYDPAQQTWSAAAPMTMARSGHSATLLQSGKLLVAGGDAIGNSAEIFDPASGNWAATGSLITARYSHSATLLPNGTVLVTGGSNGSVFTLSSAEIFDPSTGRWSATLPMFAARTGHTATLLANGTVLVAGGDSTLKSAEIYDPVGGTWARTGDMVTGRSLQTATLLPNGTVLAAGGNFAGYSAEIYSPLTGLWAPTGTMNAPNQNQIAVLLPNGTVLVAGGGVDEANLVGYLTQNIAEIYSP